MTRQFTLYRADCQQSDHNAYYPHKEVITSLDDLLRTAGNDHIFSEMKESHRGTDYYLSTDGFVLDLDNTFSDDPDEWKTIDDVSEALPEVMFYYVESRNHMKVKQKTNKKTGITTYEEPRPKYHLYFPLSRKITDHEEIKRLMLEAAGLYCYMDFGSAEPQHLFFGVSEAKGGEVDGTITIDQYVEECGEELQKIISNNLDEYESNVKAGLYEDNTETQRAIARLNTYIGRQSEPSDNSKNYSVDDSVSWIDTIERDKSIKWLEQWADDFNVELGNRYKVNTKAHPNAIAICVTCPWEDEHTINGPENESVIIIDAGGQINYLCRHGHCHGRGWKDYRNKIESSNPEKKKEREAAKSNNNATAAASPNMTEPKIDGKINKAYFHHWSTAKIPQPTKPFDSRIRDYVPQIYNIIVFSGIPWIYSKGKWIPDETTAKIRWIIEQFLFDDFKTDTYITRIYNLILHTALLEKTWKDVNKHPKSWINFKDCYLDPETMTEHEHRPEYYSLNQIGFNWSDIKAAGVGEVTDKFLNFAIPDKDDKEMTLEYMGYCLTTDNRLQKSFFIYGDGNTGKSTLLNLEKTVLGKENISGISFQDMSQRFKPSRLVGKLANICGDLPTQSLKDSSIFKQLTGNDEIDTERKNKDGFSFVNYAKMIFSTNGLPIIEGERSAGTFRRLLLVSFQQVPTKIDPFLPDKLDKEILYYIRLIVEALHRMYQRGYILESTNSTKAIAQLRQDSDITQAWLDDCTLLKSDCKSSRQDICASFDKYCQVERRTPLKPNSLYAALRAKGFMEYRTANERGFIGIYVNLG